MTEYVIAREEDDLLTDARISLGQVRGLEAFYLIFRGDPEKVIALLEKALLVAQKDLPARNYVDGREPRL